MRKFIAYLRCWSFALVMAIFAILVFLTGWIPLRIRGATIAGWLVTILTRIHNLFFNIRFTCRNPEKIRNHRGFLFPNHSSYLDIMCMLNVAPVRFLAQHNTLAIPLIGYFSKSLGCVFVDRANKDSRKQARGAIVESFRANPTPPIVLYPEGKIDPGTSLLPFFHGAFEIAIENSIPYLPCAIKYSHPELTTWGWGNQREGLMAPIMRVAMHPEPISIEVIPIEPVLPKLGDDPAPLAIAAKHAIEDALGWPHSSDQMPDVVTFG